MFSIVLRILQFLITLEPLDWFKWCFQQNVPLREHLNQIENLKCHVCEFQLISLDRITYVQGFSCPATTYIVIDKSVCLVHYLFIELKSALPCKCILHTSSFSLIIFSHCLFVSFPFRNGCSLPEIWDLEDKDNHDKEPLCKILKKNPGPYFKQIFQNKVYTILRL